LSYDGFTAIRRKKMPNSNNLNSEKRITNKSVVSALALILLMSVGLIIATVPSAVADTKTTSTAYMSLRPNPVGLNQQLLVNAWVSPTPPFAADVTANGITAGEPRTGYTFTFTKPDGTTDTVITDSSGEGATWFVYAPDQLGTWTLQFSWAGDDQFTSCTTEKQSFTVQQEAIPSWPDTSTDLEYWTYPISPQNRALAEIAGGWFQPTSGQALGYDSSGSRYNPYTTAPTTSHVLWKLDPISGTAGLVGEPYGQTAFFTASKASVSVIMYGRGYINGADGYIHCINTTTGAELWKSPGSFTFGTVEYSAAAFSFSPGSYAPVLCQVGSNFVKYNALNGVVLVNMTMGTSVWGTAVGSMATNPDYLGYEQPYAYIRQDLGGKYYLIKFDTTGTGTDLAKRIVWNVTFPDGVRQASGYTDIGVTINNGILVYFHFPVYGKSCGFDLTDGSVLWCHNIDNVEQKPESIASAGGLFFLDALDMRFQAFDMATGNQAWLSSQLTSGYPWSAFWSYGQASDGATLYAQSYAGVYAFDAKTGVLKWEYHPGNAGVEEPYGTWPFGSADPIVAGGIMFAPSTEHTPQFYYRGYQLYALDVSSGKYIWSILGYWTLTGVSEGKLFATNEYDGDSYCFGKGPTQTSVAVTSSQIGKGNSVGISGAILDMSPAQPGTPCVSKESMTAQMEYLHMQQPLPDGSSNYAYYPDGWPNATITGVPVTLTATRSDGTVITIGQTTSDANGNFVYQWTPPDQAAYTITATFEGDDSYYTSSASTAVNVGLTGTSSESSPSVSSSPGVSSSAAISPAATSTNVAPNAGASLAQIYIIAAAAIVVAVVIAAAVVLMRRNKKQTQ
jgi:outer membrane protein assembly factor BamB